MNLTNKYAELVTKHPIKVLLLMLFITVIIGSGLSKMTIRTNQDADLPENDPIVATKKRIDDIFGDKTEIMIGIHHSNIFQSSTLAKVAKISNELKRVDFVVPDQINSLATVNNVVGKEWGLDVGVFMKTVPTDNAGLKTLEQEVKRNILVNNRLVSKDNQFTVITAQVDPGYDQATLYNQVYAIVDKYQGPEQIYVTGEPIFTQEIDGGIQKDTATLIPLALLLIMIGLFVCFRNVRGVVLPMICVILSIIWAMGMMGHLGLPQTAVSTALPLLLVTIASSYAIHILIYYYNEPVSSKTRVQQALAKVLPSLILVGVTSALGAASLAVFEILMIKEFAIASMVGILGAWLINITVLPAILQLCINIKDRKDQQKLIGTSRLDRLLITVTAFSLRHKFKVVFSYLCLTLIGVFGISQIKTGLDFLDLFKQDNQARVAFNVFNDSLAGARYFNIMITAKSSGDIQTVKYIEFIKDFQTYMDQQPGVGYTHSISDIINQISDAINVDSEQKTPLTSDEQLAQYMLLYDMSGDPGDFSNLVDYQYQRAKIQVMLKTSDPDEHRALYLTAKHYLDQHFPQGATADFGGDIILWLAKVDYIIKGKIENIVVALLLIIVLYSLAYRSFSAGLLGVLPIAFGVILTFAYMGFYGLRLDMPTSIITGIAIGIGIDFSIHYLSKLRTNMISVGNYSEALSLTAVTSAKAVFFDTFTNMLGFSMLIFSAFKAVQVFGYLVSFTMLIMGLSVIFLYPALIAIVKPKFIFSAQATAKDPEQSVSIADESAISRI